MRVLNRKPEYCIKCHSCERACSNKWFKEKNAEKARVRIIEPADGEGKPQIITCTQCNVCIKVCPVSAIVRDEDGIVRIIDEKCIGCYSCVTACPEKSMFEHKEYLPAFKCVACGECTRMCPTGAVYIKEQEVPED